jgi:predicted Zn-ribbon and HTH transcriptional regulator
MFRKDLIEMLRGNPMTVKQISRITGQSVADTVCDLEHVLESVKHLEVEAEIMPAVCRKCGFQFSTEKLAKPSRCPRCNSSWLTEPLIAITNRR